MVYSCPPRSLLKTVAVTEIGVKMLPLWRSAPSVSRGLSCRTSPVVSKCHFFLLFSPLSHCIDESMLSKHKLRHISVPTLLWYYRASIDQCFDPWIIKAYLLSSQFMFILLQKRLYAYAASPLSEPLEDLQAGTAEGVELSPQSVQVCETRFKLACKFIALHISKTLPFLGQIIKF